MNYRKSEVRRLQRLYGCPAGRDASPRFDRIVQSGFLNNEMNTATRTKYAPTAAIEIRPVQT